MGLSMIEMMAAEVWSLVRFGGGSELLQGGDEKNVRKILELLYLTTCEVNTRGEFKCTDAKKGPRRAATR